MMRVQLAVPALLLTAAGLIGCASGSNRCSDVQFNLSVSPATATVNHAATPPGNQQRFTATESEIAPPGCIVPPAVPLILPVWTSSDPLHVQINSSRDPSTNGIATCLGATTAPVTLTATTGTGAFVKTATASLTCN